MYWNRNDKIQRGISALCTKERKYTPIADHTMNSPGPTTNHTSQIPRKHHHLILTLLSSKPLRYIPSILLLPVPFKTQSFPRSPPIPNRCEMEIQNPCIRSTVRIQKNPQVLWFPKMLIQARGSKFFGRWVSSSKIYTWKLCCF